MNLPEDFEAYMARGCTQEAKSIAARHLEYVDRDGTFVEQAMEQAVQEALSASNPTHPDLRDISARLYRADLLEREIHQLASYFMSKRPKHITGSAVESAITLIEKLSAHYRCDRCGYREAPGQ